MPTLTFPDGFLWGSATAAHQVEGGNWMNDWWEWEHRPNSVCAEPSGDTCDHYHRFDEDFALLASLGQNSHRLSIEWSRIEPAEGEWARAEIDHYRRVFASAAEHGLTLLVTLHHFTSPQWFAAGGGWAEETNVDSFARFCDKVAGELGDLMPYALTINEPQIVALMAYGMGVFPPGLADRQARQHATRNFLAAHAKGAEALRSGRGEPQVGIVLAINDIVPAVPEAAERAAVVDHMMGGVWLDAIESGWVRGLRMGDEEIPGLAGSCDVLGLNWYTRNFVEADGRLRAFPAQETDQTSQMGWEVIPEGLTATLRRVGRLGLPVVITENGIGTSDDERRIRYIRDHLAAAHAATIGPDGVDLRGYMYWSTMDNFEWAYGYRMTFGLIAVDRETFARRPKPSAEYYGRIARANQVEVE
jgi:beta-glucosidase